LATGDLAPATEWLAKQVQRHGGLRPSIETITHACGGTAPDETALLNYLDTKFAMIYGL
jgi:carboxypeptidase Taq